MAMAVTTGFDPVKHNLDGLGWVNSWDGGGGAISTAFFDTLTLAHAAAQDILSDDPTIHQTLVVQAQNTVLTANAATVATQTTTNRTAEGLDAAYP